MKKSEAVNKLFCIVVESIAISIAVLSVVVMYGWFIGNQDLTRIVPYGGNMKFFTAFLFFFSAIGLYNICHIVKNESEISSVVLPAVSLVISITLVTLIASKIFLDPIISIESIFVQSSSSVAFLGSGAVVYPTIGSFLLFAIACMVVLFKFNLRLTIIKILGVGLVAIPPFLVIGTILERPLLLSLQKSIGISSTSYISSIAFFLLGSGLLIISFGKKKTEQK